jgi:hypothetical protein
LLSYFAFAFYYPVLAFEISGDEERVSLNIFLNFVSPST